MPLPSRLFCALILLVLVSNGFAGSKYQVIHAFAGGATDGSVVASPLLVSKNGNVIGVTNFGGSLTDCYSNGCGTIFSLSQINGRWKETVLYDFSPAISGYPNPTVPLVVDRSGNLFGLQTLGGDPSCNCGLIYQLSRTNGVSAQTVLHSLTGGNIDGAYPYWGLVADAAGNLYGSTSQGGTNGIGIVFELSLGSGGIWTYSQIFTGSGSYGTLAIDSFGNLYGTTGNNGAFGYGTVFKLSQSSGAWNQTVLYNFTSDFGSYPNPFGVTLDAAGNLYGAATNGGPYGVGTIYKLTAPKVGFWNKTVLHTFTGGSDGAYPYSKLVLDSSGAIYGVSSNGGTFGYGNVYKLSLVNGKWTDTVLHEFGNGTDGKSPFGGLTLDSSGNLYGGTQSGGTYGFGTAFEITP